MFPQLKTVWFDSLPQRLKGLVVVIDAWAATSNIASFLVRGAKRLILANEQNVELTKKIYKGIVVGESLILPRTFFATSNRPSTNIKFDVKNKILIYMSNNGSRVIEEVEKRGAEIIITAAFVNLPSVVEWLKTKKVESLIIVLAGERQFINRKVLEERICGEILKKELLGQRYSWQKVKNTLKKQIKQIYQNEGYPIKEFERNMTLVLKLGRYSVVPRCYRNKEDFIEIKRG